MYIIDSTYKRWARPTETTIQGKSAIDSPVRLFSQVHLITFHPQNPSAGACRRPRWQRLQVPLVVL